MEFEEFGTGKEVVERFGAGLELDENVDIAVGTGLVADDGAEEGEALDTEGTDFGLGVDNAVDGLFAGRFAWFLAAEPFAP